MNPDRLQQIEKLFHSALKHEPAERAAFLRVECGDDDSLRRAVESLLAHHEQAKSFIELPATIAAAGIFDDERGGSLIGQVIERYEVLALIGAGGMGEVYLAQDRSLGRRVALKLLPSLYTQDADRLSRFEQEARTASALNHPNIITIYEIGHADSKHFIATEYLEGATLRSHLTTTRIEASEALDIAVQVASALAAAHAKGVVHRDIKPENIMVLKENYSLHRENYVKVLDFGIAKLIEPGSLDEDSPTKPLIHTKEGVVLGTVSYMSPEQARASVVDARTDIWSLGVVFYEMLAGNTPFQGETAEDVRAAILKDKLLPLSSEVPERFKWIVEKALRKDREDRYQTAREFFSDLRELQKHESASEALRENSLAQQASSGEPITSGQAPFPPIAISSTREIAAPPTSSAEYIVGEIRRHKLPALIALMILLVTAAGIIGLIKFAGSKRPEHSPAFQTVKISKLTNLGNVTYAAISPDGKYVAYLIDDLGQQSLWIRHLVTSSKQQILPPTEANLYGLTFSPDGNYVYYNQENKNDLVTNLYQVSLLGGSPKKVAEYVDSPVAFSPDGKQLAFVYQNFRESFLKIATSDGSSVRTLATRTLPNSFGFGKLAWSSDAGAIFVAVRNVDAQDRYYRIVKLRVADGSEEFISEEWPGIAALASLKNGALIVVSSSQLWYFSYPENKARRITNDMNEYSGLTVTEDAGALVTVQLAGLSNIWVTSFGGEPLRQVTSGVGRYIDPSWTPDGKIIYSSNASGNLDIWIMNQDGTNPKQLTVNAGGSDPEFSPDGRYVVFVSNQSGHAHLYRMDPDGSNRKQLTNGEGEFKPYCSPDGKWIVYVSIPKFYPTVWKIPIEGGDPVQLTEKNSYGPAISPDGKLIACVYYDEGENGPAKLAIIPIEGGQPSRLLNIPATAVRPNILRWARDGHAVTYLDTRGGVSNIWSQPIDGGSPKQLTDFKSDRILSFKWSPDGKRLVFSRAHDINDVVLISDSAN